MFKSVQVSLFKNNVLLFPVSFIMVHRTTISWLWRLSSCIMNYPDIIVIALLFLTLFQLYPHTFRFALQPSNSLFIMSWDLFPFFFCFFRGLAWTHLTAILLLPCFGFMSYLWVGHIESEYLGEYLGDHYFKSTTKSAFLIGWRYYM